MATGPLALVVLHALHAVIAITNGFGDRLRLVLAAAELVGALALLWLRRGLGRWAARR